MAAARWSLRLPRSQNLTHINALSSRNARVLRSATRRVEQRRWIQQRPPPRTRPWGSYGAKDDQEGQVVEHGRQPAPSGGQPGQESQPGRNTQLATTLAEADTSDLVTEVHIPDDPHGVLPPDHPALSILGNSSLVIQRQLEMMNVMLGFEQANRYIIMDGQGQTLGYIAEQDHGIGRAMARQMFRTHRSFTTHIFDTQEREVLRIHRPFAYINSRIRIYDPVPAGGYETTDPSTALQGTSTSSVVNHNAVAQISPLKLDDMRIIGEAQQQWAPLRRKYNLFSYRPLEPPPDDASTPRLESGERLPPGTPTTTALTEARAPSDAAIEAGMTQFAHVNEPFLSWDFGLRDADGRAIGRVNRSFAGFAREIFTDTGVYALRMDSAASAAEETALAEQQQQQPATAMTLDQRAVMLATAVSIDFDYFSRHSHAGGGGFMPIFWPMGGGAAEGGAAGAGAGAVGGAAAGEAGAAGTAVGAAGGAGAMEGAAGAMGGAAAAGRGLGTAAGPAGESAIAGAGTLAGYEAMQRGVYGFGGGDDASPTNNDPYGSGGGEGLGQSGQSENRPGNDDVWGEQGDPWGRGGPGDGQPPSAGEGEGGGGGWMDSISDFFGDN